MTAFGSFQTQVIPHYSTYSLPISSAETPGFGSAQSSCLTSLSSHFDLFDGVQSLPGLLSPKTKDVPLDDEDEDDDDDFEVSLPYPNTQKEVQSPRVIFTSSQDLLQNLHHDIFSHSLTDPALGPKASSYMRLGPVTMTGADLHQHWTILNSVGMAHSTHASVYPDPGEQPLFSLAQSISPHVSVFEPFTMDPVLRPQPQETVDLLTLQTHIFNSFSLNACPDRLSLSSILDATSRNSIVDSPPSTSTSSYSPKHVTVDKMRSTATKRSTRKAFKNIRLSNTARVKSESAIFNCNHKGEDFSSGSNIGTKNSSIVRCKPTAFICDVPNCGKTFSRAYNLTSHLKIHSTDRPFLCGTCPLAFARRHDRERHTRLHTGEKPYSCENCGCGFMRNDALHRHQRNCEAHK